MFRAEFREWKKETEGKSEEQRYTESDKDIHKEKQSKVMRENEKERQNHEIVKQKV